MARRSKPLSQDQMDPRNSLDPYARKLVKDADAWTDREIRREYSRLRDIARKRSIRAGVDLLPYEPARGQSTADLRNQLTGLAELVAAGTRQPKAAKPRRVPAQVPGPEPEPGLKAVQVPRPARSPATTPEAYIPQATRSGGAWTDREIRREYSRLRDIAQKRLARLGEAYPESKAYRENRGRFAPARELTTAQIREQLPQLARFLRAKSASVSGQREIIRKTLEKLSEHGYDFVTADNLQEFGDWMEEWRQSDAEHVFGSPTVAEEFEWAEDHDIRLEQIKDRFTKWLQHADELHAYVDRREAETSGRDPVSADQILERFGELLADDVKQEKKSKRRRRK